MDYAGHALYYRREALPLTATGFGILELLSLNRGQAFDKERIYEHVWGFDSGGDSSAVVEYVRRIRGKFSAAGAACPIKTVWGWAINGYKPKENPSGSAAALLCTIHCAVSP